MRVTIKSIFVLAIALSIAGCVEETDDKVAPADPNNAEVSLARDTKSDAPQPYQGTLNWGETYINDLSPQFPYHLWSFEARAGDAAFIDVANRDGDDTFLVLYADNGNGGFEYVAHNDDCYSGTLNSCLDMTELATGEYMVLASSYKYIMGNRRPRMEYHLTVHCQNADGNCGGSPEPAMCGSRGLAPCATGEFCSWEESAICGATDIPGVCQPIPEICTEQYAPVCGCDGQTYSNDCFAAAAGVSVASSGQCARPGQGEGELCGGIAGFQCAQGLECDMSGNQMCFADMAGTCVVPQGLNCTQQYDPVCGCDGVTYGNDCMRQISYAALAHTGACP